MHSSAADELITDLLHFVPATIVQWMSSVALEWVELTSDFSP